MTVLTILSYGLIVLAVAPLVFLAIVGLATYFDLAIADRVLNGLTGLLIVQWVTGCVVNLVGGLALVALGVWLPLHSAKPVNGLVGGLVVIPLGLWRMWRAFNAFPRKGETAPPPSDS